jgi:DNA-binding IclR family transcriptional regulator
MKCILMNEMSQASPADAEPTSLLRRAFAILGALPVEGGLALAEVAAATGLPKPTVHRILRELMKLGQAAQDEASGRYRSTGRLALPALPEADAVRAAALPLMKALHRRLDETINLGVLDGDSVRYLHVIETTRPLRLMTIPDAADPAHSTALGRVLLAALEPRRREQLLRGSTIRARTEHTVTDRAELGRIVERARRRGYAEEREENDIGVACLAVPLRGTPWASGAAVSVTIPTARFTVARRGELLAALKEEIL